MLTVSHSVHEMKDGIIWEVRKRVSQLQEVKLFEKSTENIGNRGS